MIPIRQDLRDATDAIHQRLHRHPVLLPLTSPGVTPGQYRAALSGLYGFYAPVEDRLPPDAAPAAAPRTPRAPLLAADLADLAAGSGRETSAPALAADLPDLAAPDRALGVRYVLDGAAHGGRAMLPELVRRLGVGPARGARFFASAGIDAAGEWRALQVLLAERAARPVARADIVAGAVDTFAALERWLDRCNAGARSEAA